MLRKLTLNKLNLKFCHITSEEYELCALSRLLPHNRPGLKEGYGPHTTQPTCWGKGRCRSHCSNMKNKQL